MVEVGGTDEVSNDTGTGCGWQIGIENDIGTVGEDGLDLDLHVVTSRNGFDEIDSLRSEEPSGSENLNGQFLDDFSQVIFDS